MFTIETSEWIDDSIHQQIGSRNQIITRERPQSQRPR